MKLMKILQEIIQEMPHIEFPDGDVVDLNIEKYNLPSRDKVKLMNAYNRGAGVLAKYKNGYLVFHWQGNRVATPADMVRLKEFELPENWETFGVLAK